MRWRAGAPAPCPARCMQCRRVESLAPLRTSRALSTANSVGMEGAGRRGALVLVLALAAGE